MRRSLALLTRLKRPRAGNKVDGVPVHRTSEGTGFPEAIRSPTMAINSQAQTGPKLTIFRPEATRAPTLIKGLEASLEPKAAPLVRETDSPWVWSSALVEESEVKPTDTTHLRAVQRYFEVNGANARFIPPSEFSYELPSAGIPEIAVAGRSNVGKSSLLSALLGRQVLLTPSSRNQLSK